MLSCLAHTLLVWSGLLLLLIQSSTEVSATREIFGLTAPKIFRPVNTNVLTAKSRTSWGLSTPLVKYVAITEKNAPKYDKAINQFGKTVMKELKEELKDQAWEAFKEAVQDLLDDSETLAPESMTTPTTFAAPTFYVRACTNADTQTFRMWNPAFASCSSWSTYQFGNAPPTKMQQDLLCGAGCADLRSQLLLTPAPLCTVLYNNTIVDYYSYFIELFSSRCWSWTSFSVVATPVPTPVPTPTRNAVTNTNLETTSAPTPTKDSAADFPTIHGLTLAASVALSIALLA